MSQSSRDSNRRKPEIDYSKMSVDEIFPSIPPMSVMFPSHIYPEWRPRFPGDKPRLLKLTPVDPKTYEPIGEDEPT